MLRLTLFATVCAIGAAVATPPPVIGLRAGETYTDLTPYLDRTIEAETAGTGVRRKSLNPGMVSIAARVLCGEAARQGDRETRAIAGVILNRLQRARRKLADATLADVVLKNRRGVWAFTAADPVRANGDLLWGRAVAGSRCHRRMIRIINEEWQKGKVHRFVAYWHPAAMKPAGTTPRWAVGVPATRIGEAMFVEKQL